MSFAASFATLKMDHNGKNPKWKNHFILSSVLLICSEFEGRNCEQGQCPCLWTDSSPQNCVLAPAWYWPNVSNAPSHDLEFFWDSSKSETSGNTIPQAVITKDQIQLSHDRLSEKLVGSNNVVRFTQTEYFVKNCQLWQHIYIHIALPLNSFYTDTGIG